MRGVLLFAVHFHDGRYHGAGDWPPAPARLFQALVAGAACGGGLQDHAATALRWLETLDPPTIVAPLARRGQALLNYVPNNDLDAVGGHPSRIGEVRAGKAIRPMLFDAAVPLLYAWPAGDEAPPVPALITITERLYQLGRGVDVAFATAEWLDPEAAEARLAAHRGTVHRPSNAGRGGIVLPCPQPGSLNSLIRRYAEQSRRFRPGERRGTTVFVQPPKPRFRQIAYDCPPARFLFELRAGDSFAPWPLRRAMALIEHLRDGAAARLRRARPDRAGSIERLLVGRGAGPADIPLRPRLIPLPSIGSFHADQAIRRVLLEVPPDCPLPAEDLQWALAGVPLDVDQITGEVLSDARLVPTTDETMLRHYGLGENATAARLWRSVTPIALPGRPHGPGRDGTARVGRELAQAGAIRDALRHAGITDPVTAIRVQREPFSGRGERAETFAREPRFSAARLCHAELRFADPRDGPLLLGNGRWLGLGLFAPVVERPRVLVFDIVEGLKDGASASAVTAALRRAVMARVRDHTGSDCLAGFFTGHAPDGSPLREGRHRHLAFAFDPLRARLLVIPPHALEGRPATRDEQERFSTLDAALVALSELRAGAVGKLRLQAADPVPADDPLLGSATCWESVTPLVPTRHAKRLSPSEAVAADARRECRRRGWPEPEVDTLEVHEGPRGGLRAKLRLRFHRARAGPILLGRTVHSGEGLFRIVP